MTVKSFIGLAPGCHVFIVTLSVIMLSVLAPKEIKDFVKKKQRESREKFFFEFLSWLCCFLKNDASPSSS